MPPTVLIVEDYDDSREFLRVLLEEEGYHIIESADGYDAIKKATDHCPDLILMDVGLPGIDGLFAARTIKESDGCGHIPIIAITAFSDLEDSARQAGCIDLLRKPVDILELKRLVRDFLPGMQTA